MILADTDVLIDYTLGIRPALIAIPAYLETDRLGTTAVTCFELMSGVGVKRADKIRRLLAAMSVLPLDREAAERAAQVRRGLEARGEPIGMGDSLIAGIALTHNLPLLTRNRKHFERVPSLKLAEMDEHRIQ